MKEYKYSQQKSYIITPYLFKKWGWVLHTTDVFFLFVDAEKNI